MNSSDVKPCWQLEQKGYRFRDSDSTLQELVHKKPFEIKKTINKYGPGKGTHPYYLITVNGHKVGSIKAAPCIDQSSSKMTQRFRGFLE